MDGIGRALPEPAAAIELRECAHREKDGGCKLIQEMLGHSDRVILTLCPTCSGEEDDQMRAYVQKVELTIRARGLWVYDSEVIRAQAARLSPKEKHDVAMNSVGRVGYAKMMEVFRVMGVDEDLAQERWDMLEAEDQSRANTVKCGEDVAEPGGVRLNVTTGGLGDMVAMMWVAEGLREGGVPVSFYSTYPAWTELLTSGGFRVVESGPPGLACGGTFAGWKDERETVQGRKSRLDVWAWRVWGRKKTTPKRPRIRIPHAMKRWAKGAKEKVNGEGPLVLMFPFAKWGAREWPSSHYIDLAWSLRKKGYRVAMLCDSGEFERRKSTVHRFPYYFHGLSLLHLLALIDEAEWVIGGDSGGMHLCGLTRTKGIALCGPTNNIFRDYGNIFEVMMSSEEMPCTGCFFQGEKGWRGACDEMCRSLMRLEPERVLEVMDEFAKGTAGQNMVDPAAEHGSDAAGSPHIPARV